MNCRSIWLLVLIALAIVPRVDGRTWRARVGNFKVEADFVELRDNVVILKRADNGKHIQVPFEKLSLEDVRYAKSRSKNSKEATAPFRYGFKPGVTYNYAYRMDLRLSKAKPADAISLYGGVGYTTLPAGVSDNTAVAARLNVDYHGSLYVKGAGVFKMGSEGAMSHLGNTEHSPLEINTQGEYISGKYAVSVPFMFVPLSQLPLDSIAAGETSWVREDSVKLVTKKVEASRGDPFFSNFRMRPPPDPFARPSGPRTSVESAETATEHWKYRWGEATDEHRLLHRTYELKTADGGFEAKYDSVVTFDREQQVPLRMEGEGTIQHKSENITIRIPVKFAYRLTKADAWRASKNTRIIPQLFEIVDEAKSREYMDKMQNGSANQRRDLMYYIKTLQPGAYRAEIAAEIAKALSNEDFWQRYASAQAIRRWATEKEAPAILDAVKRGGKGEYYDWVLVAAGRFPSPEAAEAVAAALPAHREPATAALIEMGPVAEDAVIKLTESSDAHVRWHAAVILGVIGTKNSLPVLAKLSSDGFAPAKDGAEKAYKYVQARESSS